MSKFEVGQKWKTRKGEIVKVVYIGRDKLAAETCDGIIFSLYMDGSYVLGKECTFDLVEQHAEPKYRPFANRHEFEPHRDKWFVSKNKDGYLVRVASYDDCLLIFTGSIVPKTFEEAFKLVTFEDGSPFGVRVS